MNKKRRVLPASWQIAVISNIGTTVTGSTPPKKDRSNYGSDIPFIKPPELLDCEVSDSPDMLSNHARKIARIIPANSVLVSCIGNLGKTAISATEVSFNQQINAIVPHKGIGPRFVFYQAQSSQFKQDLSDKSSATTVPIVNKGSFDKIEISVAPTNEQKRIVAKVKALFSKLDTGVEKLKHAREQLKIYRQSILKHAFEGKLTDEWRETNIATLGTADDLLEKVRQERDKYYKRQLRIWKQTVNKWEQAGAKGKKPSKPKISKVLDVPSAEIKSSAYFSDTIPWAREKLGNVAEQFSLKAMPSDCPDKPFIGMDCIPRNGMIPKFLRNFSEMKSAGNIFYEGQVLYGRLGSYLNKTCLAQHDGVASGEFIVLDPIGVIKAKYLQLVLHSQHFVDWADRQSFGDRPRVKYEQISQYIFGIPSIKEQQHIISEIEEKFAIVDQLEQDISDNLKRVGVLRQAILEKAFSGRLIAQDPNDEPASVLLERIRRGAKRIKPVQRTKKKVGNA